MYRSITAYRRGCRLFPIGLLLGMPLLVWVLCAFAEEVKPIRIGATVSLDGRYAEPSWMMRRGCLLWEEQVNARGGLLGRPVELIFYDDHSSPDLARSLYEKLISQDKVDLVLSPYGTPLTLAASEVTERHRFVMLASGASSEEIWSRGHTYVFGVYAPAKRYLIGLLDISASNGFDRGVILYENSPFNAGVAEGGLEWAARFGVDVVLCKAFESGKEELPALLDEVAKAGPDVLILSAYPPESYLLLDLMKARKLRPKVLGLTIAPVHPDFYRRTGEMAEGVFGISQWEPDERIPFPGTQDFIKDFFSFTQKFPSYHAGSAYAGCQILERAINACRSLDQEKIREFIVSLDTVTVIGRFKVDRTGMQIGHNAIVIQWQDGEKKIVFPASMQTAPPRF